MIKDDKVDFLNFILSKEIIAYDGRFFNSKSPESIKDVNKLSACKEITLIEESLSNNYYPIYEGRGEFEGKWCFDLYNSPNIEFSVPYKVKSNELVSGRIFAKMGWLKNDEDNKKYKSSYRKLERWIKNNYSKYDEIWWISERVRDWSAAGGFLCLGDQNAGKVRLSKEE